MVVKYLEGKNRRGIQRGWGEKLGIGWRRGPTQGKTFNCGWDIVLHVYLRLSVYSYQGGIYIIVHPK